MRQLHKQFADLGPLEPHALDSSLLEPQAIADIIAAGLESGRFQLT